MPKKYICSFCARPFSRSEHKARHERSHTKEKPFHCHLCKSTFVRRDLLQRHLRTLHSEENAAAAAAHLVAPPSGQPASKSTATVAAQPPVSSLPSTAASFVPAAVAVGSAAADFPGQVLAPQLSEKQKLHHQHHRQRHSSTNKITFNEKSIINLLTLSKKFNINIALNCKVSNYFVIWSTISTISLPIITAKELLECINSNDNQDNHLLYAILSFGAIDSFQYADAIVLLNRCWMSILRKVNFKAVEPVKILKSLTIISYIYQLYNSQIVHANQELNLDLIPIEIVLEYLDQLTLQYLENEKLKSEHDSTLWYIYIILSNYSINFAKKPTNTHSKFLSRALPCAVDDDATAAAAGNDDAAATADWMTLENALDVLTKSSSLPVFPDELTLSCIVAALSNELQSLKFNSINHFNSKDFLHNAIIMTNKLVIFDHEREERLENDSGGDDDNTDALHSGSENSYDVVNGKLLNNLTSIMKRNLLLNCPLKFQDLIMEYLNIPETLAHWNLLNLTLKEFNFEYNSTNFPQISNFSTSDEIYKSTLNYLSDLSLDLSTINNNLGITSLPILFLGNSIGVFTNYLLQNQQLQHDSFLHSLVIENHLILLKIFKNSVQRKALLNNPIVQSIIYLIVEISPINFDIELENAITGLLNNDDDVELTSFDRLMRRKLYEYISKVVANSLCNWCDKLSYPQTLREGLVLAVDSFNNQSQTGIASPLQSPSPETVISGSNSNMNNNMNNITNITTTRTSSSTSSISSIGSASNLSISSSNIVNHSFIKLPPLEMKNNSNSAWTPRLPVAIPNNSIEQYKYCV